jgi:hypothetical protein
MEIFPSEYVPNEQASAAHKKWEQANPNGDAPKWRAYRDAVLRYKKGDSVFIPNMATPHGKALVAAGKLHMSVTDIGAAEGPGAVLGINRATMLATGGTILREDTSSQADPTAGLWGSIEAVNSTRHVLTSTGGDSRPKADGVAQGNTAYRAMTVNDGDENLWANNARAQLGRNERGYGENTGTQTSGTFALFPEGARRLVFISMRFPSSNFVMNQPGFQTIINLKQTQPYGGNGSLPGNALEVNLKENQLQFDNFWARIWSTPAPPWDTWIRFAFDVTFSQDPAIGKIRIYVDRDGDGNFNDADEMSPEFTQQTLPTETLGPTVNVSYLPIGTSIPTHMRVGIYNDGPNFYGTTTVHLDNIQVMG